MKKRFVLLLLCGMMLFGCGSNIPGNLSGGADLISDLTKSGEADYEESSSNPEDENGTRKPEDGNGAGSGMTDEDAERPADPGDPAIQQEEPVIVRPLEIPSFVPLSDRGSVSDVDSIVRRIDAIVSFTDSQGYDGVGANNFRRDANGDELLRTVMVSGSPQLDDVMKKVGYANYEVTFYYDNRECSPENISDGPIYIDAVIEGNSYQYYFSGNELIRRLTPDTSSDNIKTNDFLKGVYEAGFNARWDFNRSSYIDTPQVSTQIGNDDALRDLITKLEKDHGKLHPMMEQDGDFKDYFLDGTFFAPYDLDEDGCDEILVSYRFRTKSWTCNDYRLEIYQRNGNSYEQIFSHDGLLETDADLAGTDARVIIGEYRGQKCIYLTDKSSVHLYGYDLYVMSGGKISPLVKAEWDEKPGKDYHYDDDACLYFIDGKSVDESEYMEVDVWRKMIKSYDLSSVYGLINDLNDSVAVCEKLRFQAGLKDQLEKFADREY